MQGSSFEALCLLTVELWSGSRFFLETNDEQVSFVFCDDFECRNENLLRKTGVFLFLNITGKWLKNIFCVDNILSN